MKHFLFKTVLGTERYEVGTVQPGLMVELTKNDSLGSVWLVKRLDKVRWLVELECVSSDLYERGAIIWLDSQVKVRCWSKFEFVKDLKKLKV